MLAMNEWIGPNDVKVARTLADAIVDTVREPLVVLDRDLRVVAASRMFYQTFGVARGDTQGRLFHELAEGGSAGRDAAPRGQQPPDHRRHTSLESADRSYVSLPRVSR
jgi:PAS domain-containing protein